MAKGQKLFHVFRATLWFPLATTSLDFISFNGKGLCVYIYASLSYKTLFAKKKKKNRGIKFGLKLQPPKIFS